jgi:hypothetical protein
MNLVKATVVKRNTADGASFLKDEVPLGFVYMADLDSVEPEAPWFNKQTGKVTLRPTITVYGGALSHDKTVGPMPLELFHLGES